MGAAAASVEIVAVDDGRELTDFIRLPGLLARDDPAWIEPLVVERRRFLGAATNPVFEHAEVRLWLARRDGRPVGRISAQLDRLAAPVEGRRVGFFGLVDAREDDVLTALFEAAEAWLRERGAGWVRGPFSLSINQNSGVLIDGFATPPYVMMDHHDPWLGPAIERRGYAKARDLVTYRLDIAEGLPHSLRSLAERARSRLRLRPLERRRFAEEIRTVTAIFNDAWAENWGFVPLTEAETRAMAAELKPILPDDFVQIAELDGRPVGFIVMVPNLHEAIRGLGGRLLPFGWARLLWRLKVAGARSGRVPLMGVRREIASTVLGKLVPIALIYAVARAARARGVVDVEMGWLLEDNLAVRRLIESIGSHLSKTYRVYEKPL
jgi:GNAT superfamily N-acetyltransferase